MSLEALNNIAAAEERAKRQLADAAERARLAVASAEQAGQDALAASLCGVAADIENLNREIDLKIEEDAREMEYKSDNRRAAVRAHAEKKLPDAVRLIVERIVAG
ncbi:MAG: hypothetical protein LBC78_01075 [Oscillospiraceae bacterium]|jgi:hypothetical protein|nr:hypothetical protein [Oscillospiraceae bacterium]